MGGAFNGVIGFISWKPVAGIPAPPVAVAITISLLLPQTLFAVVEAALQGGLTLVQ